MSFSRKRVTYLHLYPNIITVNECEGGASNFQVTEYDLTDASKLPIKDGTTYSYISCSSSSCTFRDLPYFIISTTRSTTNTTRHLYIKMNTHMPQLSCDTVACLCINSLGALMNGTMFCQHALEQGALQCFVNIQHALEQNEFENILIGVNCKCSTLQDVAQKYGYTTMLVVLPVLVYTMFEKNWVWKER